MKVERISTWRMLLLVPLWFLSGCGNETSTNPSFRSASLAALTISEGPAYDFGYVVIGESVSKIFVVTNTGRQTASRISGNFFVSAFRYSGGAYPGTEGTCGGALEAGASCLISVEFIPQYESIFTSLILMTYYNGLTETTTWDTTIMGRGRAP